MSRRPQLGWLPHALALGFAALALGLGFDAVLDWTLGTNLHWWPLGAFSEGRLASTLAASCLCAVLSAALLRGWRSPLQLPAAGAALLLFGLFLGNGRHIGSNDNAATRALPFLFLGEARFCFEGSQLAGAAQPSLPYWLVHAGRHVASRYPVGTALLAAPAYLPALSTRQPSRARLMELERVAAALIALACVAIVFALARRWLPTALAYEATLAYAFGTSVSSVLSKALWQHVGGAFGFSLAVAGLCLARRDATRALLVGGGLGCAIACRSTNLFPAALVALAAIAANGGKPALLLPLSAAVPLAGQALYASYYFGAPWGHGYGPEAREGWSAVWYEGVAGLLVSPARGLLLYSPMLGFGLYSLLRGEQSVLPRAISRWLAGAIMLLVLVMAKWWCWWGGRSPGERMLSDVLPLGAVGLLLAYRAALQQSGRLIWLRAAVLWSCALQLLIVYVPPSAQARALFYDVLSGPWDPRSFVAAAYALGLAGD